MAETLLSPVIEKLIELFVKDAKSFDRIHREVESLKDELEVIEPLLQDAEKKIERGQMSDTLKVWTKQIREAAIEAENAVDEYRYRVMRRHRRHQRSGFFGPLWRARDHIVLTLRLHCAVASKIHGCKLSLREIRERGQGYGLRSLEPSGSTRLGAADDEELLEYARFRSLFVEEEELVGIGPVSEELVVNLVGGPSERLVISLVGEGGIGKTTLAKRVFDAESVRRHFESAHVWVTVSQQYNLKKVLKKMMEKIIRAGSKEWFVAREIDTVEELIDCLRTHLRPKRYIVVFDDVWQESFWDDIKLALPSNNEGCRIIITTRNEMVSDFCKESTSDLTKNLTPWPLDLALELFYKKAFQRFQVNCPEELKHLSMEIVRKCQGLPLVIVTLASLLARKAKAVFEWEKVLNDLNSKAETNSQLIRVQKILSLSYYDLPYPLRSCFLYFGMFPEDYSISDERLYRLWIAEGFVKAKGNRTLEEVAAEYLGELIKRNLVNVDRSKPTGEGNWFRVHDLMLNVIQSRADELCFYQTWDEKMLRFRGKGRRITISSSATNALKNVESSKVRSLFLSDTTNDRLAKSLMVIELKKFKLLEVLDVENSLVDTIPKQIGKFFNLKYLNLRKTKVKVLPKSIINLYNLQSLDIRETLICELPNKINKLANLRHLLAYRYKFNAGSFDGVGGVRLPEGFGDLEDLQTLTLVETHIGRARVMQELEKLRKLRWLGISKLMKENGRALCAAISKMNHLERLYIASNDENEALDIEYLSSAPLFLRDLILTGRLERMPEWITDLSNLSGLTLHASGLGDEAIKTLEGLPNLEGLELFNEAYEGEQLHFEEGGFLKLKRLILMRLDRLKAVKIDEGALTLLEHLCIDHCTLLEEMPSVRHLRNLKCFSTKFQL